MGYLIDTCIWIDVEEGRLGPADIASLTKNEPVYISPITIAELKFGAEASTDSGKKQRRLAVIANLVKKPVLKIDEVTGQIFGSLTSDLSKKGRTYKYRIQDLWLASQAIQYNLSLLTWNKKDFHDIPGLKMTHFSH